MRINGTLAKWNDERGFGFIAPTQGGKEVFVHISSFPGGEPRPRVGERLSFEIETGKDGKQRATGIRRLGQTAPYYVVREPVRGDSTFFLRVVVLALLAAIGAFGYSKYARNPGASAPSNAEASASKVDEPHIVAPRASEAPSRRWSCDGRTHCTQMTSCAEAKFFLQNCPGVRMDGDGNGIPCERQWCTSPFAN